MTTYRGKHSRHVPNNDTAAEQRPRSSLQPKHSTGASRKKRAASPQAFKHHDALSKMNNDARQSKKKTALIGMLIIAALAAVMLLAYFLLHPLFAEKEEAKPGVSVTVIIPEGSTTQEIASILKDVQVIKDAKTFTQEVQNQSAEQSLKPGTYELETMMDTSALVAMLVAGPTVKGNRLTIPEGYTIEQTAEVVEAACEIPQSEFLSRAYAANEYLAEYSFLEGVYNNSLEGFLYPKTYDVPSDASADTVIRMLLDQFAIEISTIDLSYAQERGMSLLHVITMASLIEEETAVEDERPLIASVIYNRLSDGMKLQIDATVVYALGTSYSGEPLTYADLEVESPYNTYLVDELPIGPICSPRVASIEAAAKPVDSSYFYYVLATEDGQHTFCETNEEFEAAKQEYILLFGVE